jgi:methylglutaconyl-CoA hydratase
MDLKFWEGSLMLKLEDATCYSKLKQNAMLALENSLDGRSVTIALNRPDRRNALNQSLVHELTNVLKSLYADPRIRVIILTGSGSVFSAGADLATLKQLQDASYEENKADSESLAQLFSTMLSGPKVLVAKINGHAIAGGSGLVAACDVAFASSTAKFGFTEVRLGFVPALVSVLLRFRIKESDLRDILLSGRIFSAQEAKEMGIINQHVHIESLDSVVSEYVDSICRNTSESAIALTKKLLHANSGKDFKSAFSEAIESNANARSTSDCRAGVSAFLNKKDAPWTHEYDQDHPEPA